MSKLKRADIRLGYAKKLQYRLETGDHLNAAEDMLRILKDMPPDAFTACHPNELTREWETFAIMARCAYDMGLWNGQPTLQPFQSTWLTQFQSKWTQAHANPDALVGDFLGAAATQTLTFV